MSIEWDQFKRNESGEYPERWKPENAGDTITGKITQLRVATMPDGTQYPSLTLDCDGVQRELLASQAMLLTRMAALQPKIGDIITITFTQIEKLSGGRTLKHFDVTIDGTTARTESIL
jgi:hypothetical protein